MSPRSDSMSGPGEVPELDLDIRPAARPASKTKPQEFSESPLELAVDPHALVQERASAESLPVPARASIAAVLDLDADARLLADHGDPPRHWPLTPLYAWRVLRRQRELTRALVGRREEARRAAEEAEDARVAFGECVRAVAEQTATYAQALEELRRAEEVLRSCDQVLAADQDAQRARLSQIGARQSSLESELAQALNEERMIAAELSAAEEALEREGARLKRAEIELRAVQQRAGGSRADE